MSALETKGLAEKTLDEATLQQWVGHSEHRTDILHPGPLERMDALLDQPILEQPGSAIPKRTLPPLYHWLYFLPNALQSDLGDDGHPKLGGFLPPVDLPRRMWAGGRLTFQGSLQIGEAADRVSTVTTVKRKEGRSGPLCFVTVRHVITGQKSAATLTEEHDIVYRGAVQPDGTRKTKQDSLEIAGADHDGRKQASDAIETIRPSAVMLFRYSALTFNGHRIHYDREYCRDVEGYPGLVFHGPLTVAVNGPWNT
ncbi:MAG: MaoC family dehydratase N-terminal domain-containing protein, partial [Pseudomonadota bacterium]